MFITYLIMRINAEPMAFPEGAGGSCTIGSSAGLFRLCTIAEMRELCQQKGLVVESRAFL
jgi:hypothetical protein